MRTREPVKSKLIKLIDELAAKSPDGVFEINVLPTSKRFQCWPTYLVGILGKLVKEGKIEKVSSGYGGKGSTYRLGGGKPVDPLHQANRPNHTIEASPDELFD